MTSIELRETLSNLYPDEVSLRRVADDAGLALNHISFSGSAANGWYAIWKEAEKSNKVEAVIAVARKEYPDNQLLQKLSNEYLRSLNRHPPEDVKSPLGTPSQNWQFQERSGDEFREHALRTNSLKEREAYWSRARGEYQLAIAQIQEHESIDKVRLYRKMTECLRKLGEIDLAEKRFLEPALKLIERVQDQLQPNNEKAYLRLEQAYVVYRREEWSVLKTRSEDIINVYESDPAHGQRGELRFVVGSAYNLLAIALQRVTKDMVKSNKTPRDCWQQAEYFLEGLESSEAKRTLQDVKINSAVYWFDRGDCDLAVEKLEDIYHKYIANAKDVIDILPAQRQILVKHNLAAAYLHKPAYLDEANKLLQENLALAQELNDVEEWISALQLQLKVIREQVDQASNSEKPHLVEKAEKLRKELNRAIKLAERADWENDDDNLELHRLFTEIYLAAGQVDKAGEEFKEIESWRSSESNQADLYTTRASFFQSKGNLDRAIFFLEEACQLYKDLAHFGMFVDTKTRLAELCIQCGDGNKAREILREADEGAKELICLERSTHIKHLSMKVEAILQRQNIIAQDASVVTGVKERGVRTTQTLAAPEATQAKIKILFLAASPQDNVPLHTAEEARAIDVALRQAEFRTFEIIPHGAVQVEDLQLLLLRYRPQIVHFSGHGSTDNAIFLQDVKGQSAPVPAPALRALFHLFHEQIRCVVLNACYTNEQATAIAETVDCVVGMTGAITDEAARHFAIAFYSALAEGESVQSAYEFGVNRLALQNLNEIALPVLIAQRADPGTLRFTS